MQNNIDEVIANLNALNLQNIDWTYQGVFTEVLASDPNDIVLIINQTLQVIQRNFGLYGSVNVGTNGIAYTSIRDALLGINGLERPFRGANDANINNAVFRNLLKFLSEPVLQMGPYAPAGPGGQGEAKRTLNSVINVVHQRCYMLLGVLQMKNSARQWNVIMQ